MKRLFKRFSIFFYKLFKKRYKKHEVSENEIKAAAICRKLINHPLSKFLIAPVSKRRYIRNEKLKMYVVISDNKIRIINHVYSYDISIIDSEYNRLEKMFDNKVEGLRLKFEDEINSQIEFSLSSIIKKIL
jgi:hypothetical protein